MDSGKIYEAYHSNLYFFILKRVKDAVATQDILQSSFLKIHEKKHQLKDPVKLKAWIFQIVRNEINDYFNSQKIVFEQQQPSETIEEGACCLDRFIEELPLLYQMPVQMIYLKGKSLQETADLLEISLAATKGRIRRAKEILKDKFRVCCKYQINDRNQLIGQSNCEVCSE